MHAAWMCIFVPAPCKQRNFQTGAASPPCPKKLLKDTAAKREGENGTMSALEFVKKFDKKENCRRLCGRAPVPRWIKCLEVPAVQSLALRGGRFLDAGG